MIHFFQREKTEQNEIISQDNYIAMAEVITIRTTRIISCRNNCCRELYNNLIKDIFHNTEDGYILSDSYDLLQEVSFILYQNIGRRLYDTLYYTNNNKPVSVLRHCYRTICHLVYKSVKYCNHTRPIIPKKDEDVIYTQDKDLTDYTKADEILTALNLNEKQLILLNCYMANMSYMEIVKYLNLPKSSPWSLRYQIRRKYVRTFGEI